MLYDQGQLANVYLDGFIITKDVIYSYVARDILDYLRRDMIAPEGGIFSAEDADSFEFEGAKRKKEGAFYIWSSDEVLFSDIFISLIVLPLYTDNFFCVCLVLRLMKSSGRMQIFSRSIIMLRNQVTAIFRAGVTRTMNLLGRTC